MIGIISICYAPGHNQSCTTHAFAYAVRRRTESATWPLVRVVRLKDPAFTRHASTRLFTHVVKVGNGWATSKLQYKVQVRISGMSITRCIICGERVRKCCPSAYEGGHCSYLRSLDNSIFAELGHDKYRISLHVVRKIDNHLTEARLKTHLF
jgi:hypothetical protein